MIERRKCVDCVLFIHYFVRFSVYSSFISVQSLPVQPISVMSFLTFCPQCFCECNTKILQEIFFLFGVIGTIEIFYVTLPCL